MSETHRRVVILKTTLQRTLLEFTTTYDIPSLHHSEVITGCLSTAQFASSATQYHREKSSALVWRCETCRGDVGILATECDDRHKVYESALLEPARTAVKQGERYEIGE